MKFSPLWAGLLCCSLSSPVRANNDLTQVDWKLLFNQLFALEIKKETSDHAYAARLREHTAWTPLTFGEVINEVLQADTSTQAYNIRRRIYDDAENYETIARLDFDQAIPGSVQTIPRLTQYLNTLYQNAPQPIDSDDNFFQSAAGQAMMQAMAWVPGQAQTRPVSLVILPGYAGHLIKVPIFEDITHDANRFYGRPDERPIIAESEIAFEVEDEATFYGSPARLPAEFDIIAPAGLAELGNTAGSNLESTELLANWLLNLPSHYQNHDFILFGYSKGAPVILDLLRAQPALKHRIKGLVTYGGVIQGTNVANSGLDGVDDFLGNESLADFVERQKARTTDEILDLISPLFERLPFAPYRLSVLTEVFDIFDVDIRNIEAIIDELLDRRELPELRDGMVDLAPIERVRQNLLYLNNTYYAPGTFIFNLSAITDIATFSAPKGISMAPTLDDNGDLVWKDFSLDAVFLYLSSLEGFKQAPGGLYDTQVELGNTKVPLIDERPYSDSLSDADIVKLWDMPDVHALLQDNGITSVQQLADMPRNQLIYEEQTDHIHAVDLGEIKGHHWSIMRQAFRAPDSITQDYASWPFPRKAYMRALLQMMAIYHIIQEHEKAQ